MASDDDKNSETIVPHQIKQLNTGCSTAVLYVGDEYIDNANEQDKSKAYSSFSNIGGGGGGDSMFSESITNNNDVSELLDNNDDTLYLLDEPTTENLSPVPALKLFCFASRSDIILTISGLVCSICAGAINPIMTILFSNALGTVIRYQMLVDENGLESANHILNHESRKYSLWLFFIGVLLWAFSFGIVSCWAIAADNQCLRIRKLYYESIMQQEIGWFDTTKAGDLTSRVINDINQVQEGIGERLGFFIMRVAAFVTGIIIAFIRAWDIAFVCISILPFILLLLNMFRFKISKNSINTQLLSAASNGIADEILSGIRTVMSFNAQSREIGRYANYKDKTYKLSHWNGFIIGISAGILKSLVMIIHCVGVQYGAWRIRNGKYEVQDILNTIQALFMSGVFLAEAAPDLSVLPTAQGCAAKVFDTISRKSKIDPLDSVNGKKVDRLHGNISFRNIHFSYPTRPNASILRGFTLDIRAGQKVALVGESGCGKSTTIGLIERFYDPEKGEVLVDGVNIKEYNIGSLRKRIGIVTQEPVLFSTSIYQNIVWGAVDPDTNPPTKEEVIEACKAANAHQFINQLPNGYQTLVGEGGVLLSGGQKQRIAIARAIIRNPDVLLLDEATSALDTASERLVQDALDKLASNRTTISIAHRLSTIRDCDQIYVVRDGVISEHGTHNGLISMDGEYASMVRAQELRQSVRAGGEKSESEEEDIDNLIAKELEEDIADMKSSEESGSEDKRIILAETETTKSTEDDQEKAPKERNDIYCLLELIWSYRSSMNTIISGSAASFIDGAVMPCFTLVYTQTFLSLIIPDNDEMKHKVTIYANLFLLFAGAAIFSTSGRIGFFYIIGEAIKNRLQCKVFASYLSFELGYFDNDENGTGKLTSQLVSDPESINMAVNTAVPTFISIISTIICTMAISFYYSWHLALILIACITINGYAQYLQLKFTKITSIERRQSNEKLGQYASEAIRNIKTVSTLRLEEVFIQIFNQSGESSCKGAIKSSLYNGIGFGFSQATTIFVYALLFYAGDNFIMKGWIDNSQMMNSMVVCILSLTPIGVFAQALPIVSKGTVAAKEICSILDRKSKINGLDPTGAVPEKEFKGNASFDSVCFSYPVRPDIKILKGISFRALAGKSVALVGASGSGKSTSILLLQRLYDAISGNINVEGLDVRKWNITALRDSMSIVGQEPVLFNYTIGENIAYGKPGATQREIEDAAKEANIYNFVLGLPDGFDTVVGQRGGRLSGGQKQRVAIARALIRKPKLLLLDEATAALDSRSEKIVQQVLDKASKDRTTIIVAHRLSTIQNCDLIVVFRGGRIVERGTHDELLSNRGAYYTLVEQQSLQVTC